MIVQLVNYASFPQTVALTISNSTAGLSSVAIVTTLTGTGPYATNSFDEPTQVCPLGLKTCLPLAQLMQVAEGTMLVRGLREMHRHVSTAIAK